MKIINRVSRQDAAVRSVHRMCKKRGARILPLILLLLFGCKKGVQETEDNDSFAAANPVTLPCELTGYLQSDTDVDFFSFTVKDKSVLDISVSGVKGVNHSIKVWRDAEPPVLIKLIDDARKSSPERICNLAAPAGKYFVSLQHGDGDIKKGNAENPYTLLISRRAFLNEEESEPNDTIEQSTRIETGSITGYFSPASNRLNTSGREIFREEDWFSLPLDCSNGALVLDVSISPVQGVNPVLEIYDPDGVLVTECDNNANDLGESISSLGITKSGIWYIMAASKGRTANHNIPYTLSVKSALHNPLMELEPNNTISAANEMRGNTIEGRFNAPGDKDYFLYRAERAGFYRISLKPDEKTDVVLTIYNSSDFSKIIEINNGGPGEEEVFPNFASKSFICLVSAASSFADENSYRLSIEPLNASANMEVEPNDTKEEANQLNGSVIIGFTSSAKDKDYFRLKYDGRVNAVFDIKAPKNGEIKVSVTDPMGFALKTIKVAKDSSGSLSEMIDGSGYIVVETIKFDFNNPYRIEVKIK